MKHKKIVFVCTGNTCRSPMAEAALRAELKRRKISWYTISSAGIAAGKGSPMSAHSQQALQEAHIPFRETFASQPLTEAMIKEAYAVVCMTEAQYQTLAKYPNVTSVFQLSGREIPDPYGQSIDVYRTTLRQIRLSLPQIIAGLNIGDRQTT